MHSRHPIIALVGRPNVGKSTFFNRLVKSRKAIVDATPGVTRDRHYEQVSWEGRPFLLVDTGGLEIDQEQGMGQRIKEQTWQAVEEADVILFLLDGREGLTTEDYLVAETLRRSGKPLHLLVNKIDSPELETKLLTPFYELGSPRLWPVSAEHGYGVRSFLDGLIAELPEPEAEEIVESETIGLALIGRPNVGKSSLANRLLQEERMVVSDVPGTTRDSVDLLLEKDGDKYLLIDTAGIRRKGKVQERLEKFSVMRALNALERCDIALVVLDAGESITEQDTKIIGYCLEQGRACLLLANKWDLLRENTDRKRMLAEVERATNFIGYAPVLTVSALTGAGMHRLFPTLREIQRQYLATFSTGPLNRVLQNAVLGHSPSLYRGRRLKLFYVTQTGTRPPTFTIFSNHPREVHFSYYRYLVNQFRTQLKLDKVPIKLILKERQRRPSRK